MKAAEENDKAFDSCVRRGRVIACLAIVVLAALGVRVFVALRAEMISRDGAKFIWYAQGLSSDPLAEIRTQDQHPLYPALVLATHKVFEGVWAIGGVPPADPVRSWSLAAVLVTLTGGAVVIIAVYLLANSLFNHRVAMIAALLAAVAAEFCQLSGDALSDMPHLSIYLLALVAGIRGVRDRKRVWLFIAGALSGTAFLIRPEGAEVAMVVVAGVAFLARGWPMRDRAIGVMVVCLGAAIVASPYMALTGKLVPKKPIKQMLWGSHSQHPVGPTGRDVFNVGSSVGWPTPRYVFSVKLNRLGGPPPLEVRESMINRTVASMQLSRHRSSVIECPTSEDMGHPINDSPTLNTYEDVGHPFCDSNPLRVHPKTLTIHRRDACATWILGRTLNTYTEQDNPPILATVVGQDVLLALGRIAEYWIRALRVTFLLPVIVWWIRRRRPAVEMTGARLVAAAFVLHVVIAAALIIHFDYWTSFSLRHVIVLAALTLPFSAAGIAAMLDLVPSHRHHILAVALAVGLVGPTLPWMLETRYADQVHIRRAGEWIREHSECQETPAVMTTRHRAAFYANGTWVWCPPEAEVDRVLPEARVRKPKWLVFEEARCRKEVPDFFEKMERLVVAGETLERVHIASGCEDQDGDRAIIYRYEAPPGLPSTRTDGKD